MIREALNELYHLGRNFHSIGRWVVNIEPALCNGLLPYVNRTRRSGGWGVERRGLGFGGAKQLEEGRAQKLAESFFRAFRTRQLACKFKIYHIWDGARSTTRLLDI